MPQFNLYLLDNAAIRFDIGQYSPIAHVHGSFNFKTAGSTVTTT